MYTSGCPKIQNRCCQSIGSPPPDGTKKWVPKNRSNISRISATVMTGNASSSRTWVMKLIQTNIGIRISFMPGARRFRMVTKKLTAAASEAMPRIWRPSTQKSMLRPGEYCLRGQVGVAEPARVGRRVEQEADVEEQAAQQEHPVAEGVEPGKRHVPRADLQRDEIVEEHRRQRHDRRGRSWSCRAS